MIVDAGHPTVDVAMEEETGQGHMAPEAIAEGASHGAIQVDSAEPSRDPRVEGTSMKMVLDVLRRTPASRSLSSEAAVFNVATGSIVATTVGAIEAERDWLRQANVHDNDDGMTERGSKRPLDRAPGIVNESGISERRGNSPDQRRVAARTNPVGPGTMSRDGLLSRLRGEAAGPSAPTASESGGGAESTALDRDSHEQHRAGHGRCGGGAATLLPEPPKPGLRRYCHRLFIPRAPPPGPLNTPYSTGLRQVTKPLAASILQVREAHCDLPLVETPSSWT